MSKPKYLPAVYTALADEGYGPTEIARELGDVTEASVRRGLEKARKDGWHPIIRPHTSITLEKPLRHVLATDGSLAVTADFHFPVTDYEFVNEFLAECAQRNVKKLLIAGDFLNMDALSRFDHKQESAGLNEEITMANKAMRLILNQFDDVYFTWGNHDARFHKAMGYKVDFATSMKMVFHDLTDAQKERLHISNLDHMVVDAYEFPDLGEDKWFVCHPKTYSRKPLSTAMELAATKNMNIACAHSHHHAYGWDRSGRLRLVEVGGFFDREKVEYLQRTDSYPNWQNGYMILTESNELILRGRGVSYDGSR